ncbi:MAG: DMT family transporter [Pseudomonadota bacterium]
MPFSTLSAPVRATLLTLAAMGLFATMGVTIRLSSEELHPLVIVFFRTFFGLLLFTPMIWRRGLSVLHTRRLPLYLLRAVFGTLAMTAGFWGLTLIPLAEATALNFTAPLFATMGAVLVLGERIRFHRTAALIVGFLGVLIVLRPGAEAFSAGAWLTIGGAFFIAASIMVIKFLTTTEAPETIALYMVLLQTPVALIAALFVWDWPSLLTLFWLICLATAGTLAHLAWTHAIAIAEVTQLQPLEFAKLPLTALFGYLIFAETPTVWTLVGGVVIFAATAYITHREARMARRRVVSHPKRAPIAPG